MNTHPLEETPRHGPIFPLDASEYEFQWIGAIRDKKHSNQIDVMNHHVFSAFYIIWITIVSLLGCNSLQAAFEMPRFVDVKRVTVCNIDNDEKLTKICEWVDDKTVERICKGITDSKAAPKDHWKVMLEPGPIVVLSDAEERPKFGYMQTLDGWMVAYEIKTQDNNWKLGEKLMKIDEYRRRTSAYSCWQLVYDLWLHTVNPELYDTEKTNAAKPSNKISPSDKPSSPR